MSDASVIIRAKLDEADFKARIEERGNDWAKAMKYTVLDMRRRAPVIVARNTAEVYNIAQYKLNPNNKRGHGEVSLSGGIKTFTMVYRGMKIPISEFKGTKPKTIKVARKRPYRIYSQVVKGQQSETGHWNKPHTEGGRYSANSPWMVVPGVPGPVMRLGSTLGGTMKALAVPQMVVSMRHDEKTIGELNDKMGELLEQKLRSFGCQ